MKRSGFELFIDKNVGLSGFFDEIGLEFVERVATPQLLTKFNIQLYLSELSLPDTTLFLEIFDAQGVGSTVYNRVQKTNVQPQRGRQSDQVAIDESVIQLDDQRDWLYVTIGPETNQLLHPKVDSNRANAPDYAFVA